MFLVVGKVFLDNAAGVLGEVDEDMQAKIAEIVLADPDVKDLPEISVLKEGDALHVELKIEVDPKISLAKADDIQDRLEERVLKERGVTDVVVEFDEDDQFNSWDNRGKIEKP
jgi:divalent metal cation (Fe/Co/Zn/Cd) transporter